MSVVTQKVSKDNIEQEDVFCSKCNIETNHNMLAALVNNGNETCDDGYSVNWWDRYQIIQCMGCKTISFRQSSWFSEVDDEVKVFLYPERGESYLKAKDFWAVPAALREIYAETLSAYNNNNLILCAVGLRAIVEGVCAEKGIKGGNVTNKNGKSAFKRNLERKISCLHESGILTSIQAEVLHAHRFLGNNAVHELSSPPKDDLALAIEIIESILDQVYEFPHKAGRLKSKMANKKSGK